MYYKRKEPRKGYYERAGYFILSFLFPAGQLGMQCSTIQLLVLQLLAGTQLQPL